MWVRVSCAGNLEQRCPPIELQVSTPAELISVMEANYPGFGRELLVGKYAMVAYSDNSADARAHCISDHDGHNLLPEPNVLFLPTPCGEATAVFGVQLFLYTIAPYLAAIGVALILAAVADAITPKLDDDDKGDGLTSSSFGGPVNTTRQGNPVPVCYGGPMRVGSQVVSVAVASEDVPI